MTLEDLMMAQLSLGETTNIIVRMLGGEQLPVRIRMSDHVSIFPKQFVDQHNFNPWIAPRLRFYAHGDFDEDTPLSKFSSVHRFNGTWRDYLSEYTIHYFDIIILDDDDTEINKKMKLLREIICSKGIQSNLSDNEVYGEYLHWYIYYRPLESSFYFIKPKRRDLLNTFVEQQFQPLHSSSTNQDDEHQMIM